MLFKAIVFIIPAFCHANAQTASDNAQNILKVTSFRLHNGMTVWLNKDNTQPKAFGAVVVRAGAKDCPNSGIAHYLEHLLFKGTDKIGTTDYTAEKPWLDSISSQYDLLAATHNAQERAAIQRHINFLSQKAARYAIPNEYSNLISLYGGSGLNAYTSFDETVFHNYFAPQYFRQWCELNAERLRHPVFRLFQGELETVYEEKNMYADNLLASTAEKVQQYALAGTPYAFPIIGATDSLKNPRLSEMTHFFKRYYVPENMGLMLAGNLSDSVRQILEETFGTLQGRPTFANAEETSRLQNFRVKPVLRIKVPIPIVKIGGFAWQAPDQRSKDYAAFKVMASMLTNDDRTGLIDSLTNKGKLMFAAGMGYDFKDFSAWGFGFVPKIFGSRKKAEALCFKQIDKLRQGQFSKAAMEAEKLTLLRDREMALETISGRSKAMINAFSHGLSWGDVTNGSARIEAVTKEDIMRVARTYINDDSLKIVKKYGSYPKEHIAQPGYKPILPRNAGKHSAYADALSRIPVTDSAPRLTDINNDAGHIALAPLVNLYTVPNPENDVFTLKIIYRRGSDDDSRLAPLADYLNETGTMHHDKQSLGRLLRQQGATLEAASSSSSVCITLTGFDDRFRQSMALLHEFITEPKADKDKFSNLVNELRLEEKTFFKQNRSIASAVMSKAARGEHSGFLTRLSSKELKRMNGETLIALFKKLQHWQTDIVYCGRLNAKDVENSVKSCISIDSVSRAWEPERHALKAVDATTVYIYDNPAARQTVVGSYSRTAPMTTAADRSALLLWGNYFGSGMQSVTFQEIREFRSLAYYAHGTALLPDLNTSADMPCGYETFIGTQSDKAMQTVTLLDSLIDNMPLHEVNVTAAKQSIVNNINNGYPSFRDIGSSIASLCLRGYKHDPNRDILLSTKNLGMEALSKFYSQNIRNHPHALIIVGNKKNLDMNRLSRLGKIVELKKADIYKR